MALAHIVAAFAAVVLPVWSRLKYQTARRRLERGAADARRSLYRRVLVTQGVMTAAVFGCWFASGAAAPSFGLGAPRSWTIAMAVTAGLLGFFGWSAVQMRRRAADIRAKLHERAGALLPESPADLRWFGAISLLSGFAEELLYRGFFFYYLRAELPSIHTVALVLLTSGIFGVAHLYQGRRGIAATTIAGVLLGFVYAVTGTLFAPMIVHSAANLRALPVFWPGAPSSQAQPRCQGGATSI